MSDIKQISFQFKCNEDWNMMRPCEGGRHCTLCDKTVYDFSNKSMDEYQSVLQQHKGDICGRFSNKQTTSLSNKIQGNGSKWLAALTLFASFAACDDAHNMYKDPAFQQVNDHREEGHTLGAPIRDSKLQTDGTISKGKKHDTLAHVREDKIEQKNKPDSDTLQQEEVELYEVGFVDHQPRYLHGGEDGMMNFLMKNISIKDTVYGKVIVGFTIDVNGQVKHATIIQGLSPSNDSAVLKAIYQLEFEKPKQAYEFTLPIIIEGQE